MIRNWKLYAAAFAALVCALWLLRPTPQPTRETAPEVTRPTPQAADPDWLARLHSASPGTRDQTITAFLDSELTRSSRIATLLALLSRQHGADRLITLDLLARQRPIEAAAPLAAMLRETDDPELAVALLETLRAATLITDSSLRIDDSLPSLSQAFETIQQAFRDELARPAPNPDRLGEAILSIPDLFPAGEANELILSLIRQSAADTEFPIPTTELQALWLENAVSSVNDRDFRQITRFIHEHPDAIARESARSRLIEQLRITPLRENELEAVAPLIGQLRPPDSSPDELARWHQLRSQLGLPPEER